MQYLQSCTSQHQYASLGRAWTLETSSESTYVLNPDVRRIRINPWASSFLALFGFFGMLTFCIRPQLLLLIPTWRTEGLRDFARCSRTERTYIDRGPSKCRASCFLCRLESALLLKINARGPSSLCWCTLEKYRIKSKRPFADFQADPKKGKNSFIWYKHDLLKVNFI